MIILDPIRHWLAAWRWPHRDEQAVVETVEQKSPVQQTAQRVLRDGRAMHVAVDETGWHLRRRARQIRRDFGHGLTIIALPKALREGFVYRAARRRLPWWWL